MSSRVLTFLFTLALGLGLLVAEGFCTTAKKVSADGKEIRHISEDVYPPETIDAAAGLGKYSTSGSKDVSDCYNLIPDPEVPAVTEHDLVGSTWYEYQKNGSMGRMISVTSAGTGGYRHVSWMWTAGVYPGVQRRVYARSKPDAGAWGTAYEVGLGTLLSGYSNQTHFNDGTSVVIFHRTGLGGYWCYLGIADGAAPNPQFHSKWDLPDEMPEGPSGKPGAWPKCEVLYTVDTTVYPHSPLNFVHIIENEGNTLAESEKRIGYLRCYIDPSDIQNLKCQTPTVYPEVYNIPANTAFQDEVYSFSNFTSCDISAIVVTGRGIQGKRVAIPYMPPAAYGTCDYLSDVAFIECLDNGDGWIDGTDWPPTIHKITNYGTGGYERAYHDLSACYDYEDSLHVVWVTAGFDPAQPGYYQPEVARLYHWSRRTGISFIASKIQEGANPSAHNLNISKMSISPNDPIYHPGGDSSYLFCIWVQVDSSDQNAAGDQGNADIYGSGSFDGGNTWERPYNLTGTKTPGCYAGECVSEHMPSLALNMEGGDLHIEYICDRDAGFGIYDEGAWTENYVMYMRVPEPEVTPGPRGEYKTADPPHWYHPHIKVLPNQTRTISFKVFSIGNENLTYSVTSDNPCIQVSVPPTVLAPKDSVEISVLLDGTGVCNGTFIAGNVILNTDEAGGMVHNLRVHAVVADDYYECPVDPETYVNLENGMLRLYANANGEMRIHDIGTFPDTVHEVFFDGGIIVATTQHGDTVVGRFMGNDWHMGARDKLYTEEGDDFWIVYTENIFIEATHLPPPAHFKWWWWEVSKRIKFFKETAPDDYKYLVIEYVTVTRKDPPSWWPDLTPFTNYEDTYIGVVDDIDCPYDSSGGPEPNVGEEDACNEGGYDVANEIAWQRGFGRAGEHPEYNDYYCGIALADADGEGPESTVPYGTYSVKNNRWVYPNNGWGWKDGDLYGLASQTGNNVEDPDSLVDRSTLVIAAKINAGSDPGKEATITVVKTVAPEGPEQMEEIIRIGRQIVEEDSKPCTVYVFNRPTTTPPKPEDAQDHGAEGYAWQMLHLLNGAGKPGTIQGDNIVDPNNPNEVLGTVIRDAQNNVIGYRSKDGKKEAYNVNSSAKTSDAWSKLAKKGVLHIIKHGYWYYEEDGSKCPGGGVHLDSGKVYGGFGGGTGAPGKRGDTLPPYPLPPRPEEDSITVIVSSCWSDIDPPGDVTSVTKSALGVPGTGTVQGCSGVIRARLEIALPDDQAWDSLFKVVPDAYRDDDHQKAQNKATQWVANHPFGRQYEIVQQAVQGAGVTPKLRYYLAEERLKNDTSSAGYYHCPILFRPEASCSTEYLPGWCSTFTARIVLPVGALSTATIFHIRQLADLPQPAPSGWRTASGAFDFRHRQDEPELVNPALISLAYFRDEKSIQMFRFDETSGEWIPAGGTPVVDTVNQTLTVDTWTIGVFAAFGEFLRGDANGDGIIDIGDVVYLINYLFRDGLAPDPLEAGNANCDEVIDIGDVVYLINYLFRDGDPPGCD